MQCNTTHLQRPHFNKSVPASNQIAAEKTLVLECQTGYKLTGGRNAECQVRPFWSQTSKCDPVNCGQHFVPANIDFTEMNFLYSQHVNVTRLSAYEQTSGGTSLQRAANGGGIGEQIVCTGVVNLIVSITMCSQVKIQSSL